MALNLEKKQEIIKAFATKANDTGSCEVQVALLNERIRLLTEHLKTNPKDHSSRLGLLKLVAQRRNLLKYIKRTDHARYVVLIEKLGIKDR
ncbi:ribosomal protein S15 [Helicobacter pylori GAM114Ai]|uniref:30S ribosomal protein S15 n=1 Tax=Helicobacter pylori TaxID=210 RepID=UPI00026B3DE9|nr:30S ribosomal protein S15 [Helicobacter pylori]EJC53963.1 ribosomal protein S15 [Helicobacter pylori Hp P-41]EMG87229.1 ribosomal protein S15 [Helicobacter pylori GAM114Ai]PUD45115.1 30S ribosomal protein S15 [Helicobacter pylori]WQV44809.1 30S ribosomal protein S15 [Helicobacter pylori]WRE93208.1 30S ribosomal protein S15 [Helicobacter pylori]